jgi:hypothetical protein
LVCIYNAIKKGGILECRICHCKGTSLLGLIVADKIQIPKQYLRYLSRLKPLSMDKQTCD